MKKLTLLLTLIIAVIALSGCTETPIESVQETPIEPETTTIFSEYDYEGDLIDVSKGKATGTAKSKFENDTYTLLATFENLPTPPKDFFYEGWVVRNKPLSILSTGETTLTENSFTSEEDLTDHDFYVLTLEPDDNDPAPAEHILEGTMIKLIK